MNFLKINVLARRIHRFCVIFVLILGLTMATTGLTLKYPDLFPFVDDFSARRLHGLLSPFFAIILLIMISTGLIMYLTPWLIKRIKQPQN